MNKSEPFRNWILFFAINLVLTACAAPPPPKLRAYKAPQLTEKIVYVNNGPEKKVDIKRESADVIRANYRIHPNPARNENSYALVIGIATYQFATPVSYADYSAYAFKELATKSLGVPEENVLLLVNETATSGQIKSKIELVKELAGKGSKIYVYFAGHGVPGRDGNSYLLPSDMSADAIHLEPNLMLNSIYKRIAKSEAANVYFFVDSCFSGKDDRGELLYKGVAPILITKESVIPDSLTVLSAGGSADFANDLEEKKQRMFTYYLIKALEGGEKHIENVFPQIQNQVKRASLMKGIGYKQVPELTGKANVSLY